MSSRGFNLTGLVLAIVAMIGVALLAAPTVRASIGDLTTGSGVDSLGNTFTFSASVTGPNCGATGTIDIVQPGGQVSHYDVGTLITIGQLALIGSTATSQDAGVVLLIRDGGDGADGFIRLLGGAPDACFDTPWTWFPIPDIASGDVLVRDSPGDDVDGDGIADDADNCVFLANGDQRDVDSDDVGDACDLFDDRDRDVDGVLDADDNCAAVANPNQLDFDRDGFGDACDPDDDNDLQPDEVDAFPLDPREWRDFDGDRVGDNRDNCRLHANASQSDTDRDGLGDACDPVDNRDLDGDGVFDTSDNCRFVANADQKNTDGDTLGDVCDADDDNDGVLDTADNCVLTANVGQGDLDHDGGGDACDPSDDRTAEQQLTDLIAQLQTEQTGSGGSYLAKLGAIAASMTAGNATAACALLDAFANEVRAQAGKKLTQTEADALLRETAAIKGKAGCQ